MNTQYRVGLVLLSCWIGTSCLHAAEAKRGLAVYIGSDIAAMIALRSDDDYLVHALNGHRAEISAIRRQLMSQNLCGPVSVQHWDGDRLPYANDLANRVVVDDEGVSMSEVMRILAPSGTAVFRKADGSWTQAVKPRPPAMDDWTHYLHGSTGNPVAQDDLVHSPRQIRWVATSRWARHHEHMASMNALVSAAGKLFYICDEGPQVSMLHPPIWRLSAREAYNGLLLWQRDMGQWFPHLYPLKSGPASMPRRLVADEECLYVTMSVDGPVSVIDNATGKTVRKIAGTEMTREIVLADGMLCLVRGDAGQTTVTAADPTSGEVLWDRDYSVATLTLAGNEKQVVFFSGQELVALAPQTGASLWTITAGPPNAPSRNKVQTSDWLSARPPRRILHDHVILLGLGSKIAGCAFGFLMRPDRIGTLDAWDEHTRQCEARLRELAALANSLGLTIAVENHLYFCVEELRDLIKSVNSPNVRVLFDVGNIVGRLDDPTEAADILGPLTVATHYKDFAIEEVARSFRFCMVPRGCGSLRLPQMTERLLKHVDPEMGMSIEMINGQHFELNWLEDRSWTAYRNKTARQLAATLRHVRGKAINIDEYKLIEEVDKLPHEEHVEYEQDRIARCITYLKGLLDTVGS